MGEKPLTWVTVKETVRWTLSDLCVDHTIYIDPSPSARLHMTRDMELIRKILLAVKAKNDCELRSIEIEGEPDKIKLMRHMEMLVDLKILEGTAHYSSRDNSRVPDVVRIKDMFWEGHDLLAAMENEAVWAKIKNALAPAQLAALPLETIKSAGLGLLKKLVFEQLGL